MEELLSALKTVIEIAHKSGNLKSKDITDNMLKLVERMQASNSPCITNWVSVTERPPKEEWGDYMVCLKNDAIFKANYSRIGAERWLIVGVGDTSDTNPVKYWAELPEPPCL